MFRAAEEDLERAAALAASTREDLVIANVRRGRGDLEKAHGRYTRAKHHLQVAEILFKQIPDSHGLADALVSLADIAVEEGQPRLALDLIAEAAKAAKAAQYEDALKRIEKLRRWIEYPRRD
jgi:tetratricopeptide (TPR) repeat protein